MQTFLPYSDFRKSAESLDKKRCWKQVVEAKQIIDVLEQLSKNEPNNFIGDSLKRKRIAWENHPAVKMWIGYNDLLKHYYNVFLDYCINQHKINTKLFYIECKYSNGEYNDADGEYLVNGFEIYGDLFKLSDKETPFWLGNEDFHRSHRSRLIEKDREFYLPKFPEDEGYNDGKYWWPDMKTKTFKII